MARQWPLGSIQTHSAGAHATAQVPEILSRYREAVDAGLKSALAAGTLPMYDMLRYHMGWLDEELRPVSSNGGKAVRPSLCLFACEAAGADWHDALPTAVAFELVHNFSLVHDDIQDGDIERRHRPTLWYQWGHSHGLNSGAALHAVANLVLHAAPPRQSPETVLKASRVLTRACLEMIEGQTLDMSYEQRPRVTTADYLLMIERKTGALLEGSLVAGAGIGTDDPDFLKGMRSFGHAIGRLFQVKDDMLGVWGKAEETGKPTASDLHRRKKSLPVVYALERAGSDPASQRFASLYRTKDAFSDEDIAVLLDALEDSDAQQFCQHLAEEEAQNARKAFDGMRVSTWAKTQGSDLVTFLLQRDY